MSWGDIDTAGMPPTRPSLQRLETLVRCMERRDKRADEKLRAATREKAESAAALERARADRDARIADNDDLQMTML